MIFTLVGCTHQAMQTVTEPLAHPLPPPLLQSLALDFLMLL
jgi:hypothetical protein